MRQRFHFDLTNGEKLIRDDEGVDANGPGEAIEEAQAALESMRGNEEAPEPGDGWQLIIRDESGMTLWAIPIDDAVSHPLGRDRTLRAFHQ